MITCDTRVMLLDDVVAHGKPRYLDQSVPISVFDGDESPLLRTIFDDPNTISKFQSPLLLLQFFLGWG